MDQKIIEKLKRDYEENLQKIKNGESKASNPADWKRIENRANMPERSVKLTSGFLNEMFEKNIKTIKYSYSLPNYSTEHPSWEDATIPEYNGHEKPGWTGWLPASNDARVMGGAANSFRYTNDSSLKEIVDNIVSKIEAQMREDGYYNYYPEEESFCRDVFNSTVSERKNYDRVFWIRGMISAHKAGNAQALSILRKMYDWFNNSEEYLKYMFEGGNATNGFVGGGLMYHTELGKNEDILTTQKYYDQEYFIEALKNKTPEIFAYYPGKGPHCYLLLELEKLADEYRATGDKKYLDALLGGWQVYKDGYKHIGGATAICEGGGPYPYKSYYITTGHNGETCGTVFWIWVNAKLLQMFPFEEKYATEIEEGIYNIMSSCRDEKGFTRYHNRLHGTKVDMEEPLLMNCCCEVSSVMMLSELPKYIYMSDDKDSVWVNLFANSQFESSGIKIELQSDFPYDKKVKISAKTDFEGKKLHLRIPSYLNEKLEINISGRTISANSGEYITIDLQKGENLISFELPLKMKKVVYEGVDKAESGNERAAVLYGPILMALCVKEGMPEAITDKDLKGIEVKGEKNLWFALKNQDGYILKPYYDVESKEKFTCFPEFE